VPIATKSEARCGDLLGNAAFVPTRPELLEPVTLTLTDPIVGVGTPFTVTELCTPGASAAKPTEAGFARKTEYTFLRKVSPMIHPGPLLDPVYTKIDPTHCPLEICANWKSTGEMDHDWPPKENATLMVVEQAIETKVLSTH
jgi:hypothetical protein